MIDLIEGKNTHLEHAEDDIINNGYDGGVNAINFLSSLKDMLSGSRSSKVNVSVKWDGAPAIVCGPDPRDGKFFCFFSKIKDFNCSFFVLNDSKLIRFAYTFSLYRILNT